MKTFTQLQSLYGSETNNTEPGNITLGSQWINDSIRTICNIQGGRLRFLESVKDMFTVANQERYQIPNGFRKLMTILVWSETTTQGVPYTPEMIFDPVVWNRIKQAKLGVGQVPYFTYVENQTFAINPIPSTTGNLIQVRGRLQTSDLTIADYTIGTIVSIANGDTLVTGSGTVWTQDMVGRYIQITQTTAANGGDGFWYQIGAWIDATHITLLKPYEGISIAVGSATYTIGQCSVVPEAYEPAIVYRAAALYYQQQKDLTTAKTYWMLYDGGFEAGYQNIAPGGLIGQMLANEGETEEGSYVPPLGSSNPTGIAAPYYFPFTDATGFN